ncbi:glycosyltransferase N-terminal domain-containing protein [uncultured Roseobacter sp.]|uniref:3-deoxy-D-manno-octulosonic acid transferase n=1 Tax=uncultured Roseobacter sp. TaxID=114847 RepID=UPI0026054886|nr:glycosyltransferase N-terminal domain-containing protein [uncultured Roseobacter sp.]
MGRSIGLAAWRALSRHTADRTFVPTAARSDGELVWIHAAEPENFLAVQDIALRIASVRHGVQILVTLPDSGALNTVRTEWTPPADVTLDCLPSEHPDAISLFLDNYRPDFGIWVWGKLRPSLIDRVQQTECPMILIDADSDGFDSRHERWLPDVTRTVLSGFDAIFARSPSAAERLTSLGISGQKVQRAPPLQAGGQALPCDDTDLSDLSTLLGGRPVWLAARLQKEEAGPVLAAHRNASRLSHRLLLILHPGQAREAGDFADMVRADGMRLCDWSAGEEPDDATQVLLADDAADLGLFYRVAPVTFLGSSLVPGYGGCNPFEAAALGSAVLYGPNVRRYLAFYSRLAGAGAARIVNDASSLSTAVTQLISPDQAAAMAHAGWDVISKGAALTDQVIGMVEAALDAREEQAHEGA